MHSTPLRKVSTTRRNGVTVTKLKKTTEHETRIFELRTTAKDRAVVYIGGNEATCERVRPEQPWHETFTELLERHRSPLSQPQPGNGAWECERKTWRVCEALISTAPAIARIWECEPNIWRECEAGTPCYDDVTPERTNTVFRIVDGWRHEQPGPGTVIERSSLYEASTRRARGVKIARWALNEAVLELHERSSSATFLFRSYRSEISSRLFIVGKGGGGTLSDMSRPAVSIQGRGPCKKVRPDKPWFN